uniref:NADH dehydrogenase subunit 6 n=2 Tax=Empoascanara TaxID=562279 RepID=A0AA51RFH8_9HEMI|nr:NADH dehydrogenase subunit 6 [Empoascanara alami]YP_010952980.1 NADH dehydrogenase subunit 6 [Empoascanara hongkongica]WMQ52384.1 NADH dehydrogenase subunit 6 [Empoascanara alami]WMQ52423.1 NADH dehydrogenase subunit 6 [Empoascanara hongkongica]
MKFMIMKIMLIISSAATLMKNPMSLGILLMTQTMMMILLINTILSTSWFAMITFLMMIGGLLIIFMYMSSIASNEKFKIKMNLTLMILILLLMTDDMLIENQPKETQMMELSYDNDLSLIKIYNMKSMMMTIMMVLYLLITMVCVSNIVKHHYGPLRSYNK